MKPLPCSYPRSERSWLIVGVFAALIATASVGCNRVVSDWDHAKQANSVPAYTDFISKHPNAAQVEEARLAIKGIALKAAITGGDVATLQSLTAESPGIVTQKDLDGRSPLHWAAYAGARQSLVEILLEAKADINAKDHNGDTPLDIAVSSRHNDAAKFLKQQGGKYGRFPAQFVGVWSELGSSTHGKITIKPDQLIWEREIAGNKDAEVVGIDKLSISAGGLSLEFPAEEKREVTMGGQPATMSEHIDVDAALERNTLKLRYQVGSFAAFGAISGPGTYAGMVGSRDVERTFSRD
jgi:hypothetical protein